MNVILGLVVLTPVLGAGLGLVLGLIFSGGKWKQGLSLWLVCMLAALPAFGISKAAGGPVDQMRLERRNKAALREPERKLRELAAENGWSLTDYDLTQGWALAVYELSGQNRLAYLEIGDRAMPVGDIDLNEVAQHLTRAFGAPVQLKPVNLFNRRFLAVVNAREVVVEIQPLVQERIWRVRCDQDACPTRVDLPLPFLPS